MSEIGRAALFGKLNSLTFKSVEAATVFCKMRGNPYVELAHWIHQLVQHQDCDLHRIVAHFDIDASRLATDVVAALDRLPRGATSISDFSEHVEEVVERGWVYGSLLYGASKVRSGHLVLGAVATRDLRNALHGVSAQFKRITYDELSNRFDGIVAGSPEEALEDAAAETGAVPGEASSAMAPAAMGRQEALAQFTVDLVEAAASDGADPIVGRDAEIRQLVDILMRRRQNNPILTGEAGVGKTAVVEGFAQKIAADDVPPPLRGVSLRTLDVGLLQAGASMKGEFENRLRQVIEEVQASPKPIILFIDEAHTLVGAGGAAGTGDAANLLKPALARGTLRTIAATTWAEYKKHIEKDPALTRRFQVVQVDEPSEERCVLMMRGLATTMEQHHRVQILDEALEAAVRLSHRYIPARQLPDKAVSLIDTAAARVAISQHAVPAAVDDALKQIRALETELEIIGREAAVGVDTKAREVAATEALEAERARHGELESRWERERDLVDRVLTLRAKLRGVADADVQPGGKADVSPVEVTIPSQASAQPEAGVGTGPDAVVQPTLLPEAVIAAGIGESSEAVTESVSGAPSESAAAAGRSVPAELLTSGAAPTAVHDVASDTAGRGHNADTATNEALQPGASVPDDEAATRAGTVAPLDAASRETCLAELQSTLADLDSVQGEQPLIAPSVDEQAVASVVADWTGIPVGRMVKDELQAVLTLDETLKRRVIGQDHALEMIARRVQTSRASLDNPSKPIGVFMLAGPSGVGKTETALALAEALYGGEQNVVTINMSEFQEAHTVSTLKGAPPGYVGYGEGGILTEAVRRKPYSVVLLDEVEKAHSDVHEIFFQVFDKGQMEDGEGRQIDFRNTLILLTSNVGSDEIIRTCADPAALPSQDELSAAIRGPLRSVFPAALLGRLIAIPYVPLSPSMMGDITRLQLDRIARRVSDNHDIPFEYDDAVVELIVSRCNEVESGGRMIDAILTNTVLPEVSRELLGRMLGPEAVAAIRIGVRDGEFDFDLPTATEAA